MTPHDWRRWFRASSGRDSVPAEKAIARPFATLWLAAFLIWISFYLASAVLPLYAKSGGASDIEVGIVVGFLTLISAVAAPIGGTLADRFGRRRVMLAGAIAFAICAAGYV